MAPVLGFEPRTTESKSVVLPITPHRIRIEFVAVVPPSLLAPFTWINKARAGLGKSLGILDQIVRHLVPGSSDPSGIEPATFYWVGPSKKPNQRVFLLLTLQQNLERVGRVELRIISLEDCWAPLAAIYPH